MLGKDGDDGVHLHKTESHGSSAIFSKRAIVIWKNVRMIIYQLICTKDCVSL